MSKITGTIYNKSKNYFMKKANNIYTRQNKTQMGKVEQLPIWVFRYELLK